MDEAQQLDDLRGKLERRNVLLDIIRKAYHRDVIAVKECLIENAPESLAFVPSIDLRETFRLFAPQECELRVRPCWNCGGQLEVIHRESSRIVNLKHAIQVLEEREKDLRLELVNTKADARGDRDRLVEVMERSKEERDLLLEKILALKREVADRNALEAEVRQLRSDGQALEETLARQQPILAEHKRLVVENKEVKEDAKQWKTQFHEQVEHNAQVQAEKESLREQLDRLQREHEQLKEDLHTSRADCKASNDQCAALTQDLADSKAAAEEVEGCLRKAEHAMEELESDFRQEKQRMEGRIGELESQCAAAQSRIATLGDESRKNAEKAGRYRRKIEATLEGARRRGSIAFVPQGSDALFAKTDELIRELESQRHKTATLFNLLLGCIRSTYEHCRVQEKLLRDNGSELHHNERMLQVSQEPTNDKARRVLEHLDKADESDVIEWASVLVDDTDQRHILGNLQNRLQMGQFSLDKAFQKVHKAHAAERRKCQGEHNSQLEVRRSRIWELEQQLSEAVRLNRLYEEKMIKMRAKYDEVELQIDAIRGLLRKMRREARDNADAVSKLKEDYETLRMLANRLLDELSLSKKRILAQKDELSERQQDIHNRDAAIGQLETLLQSITQRYAENERARAKVTHEVSVQAVSEVAEQSSHADFLPTPLQGVVDTAENRENFKKPSHALLPGRIWSLRAPTSLHYRRAIDKL